MWFGNEVSSWFLIFALLVKRAFPLKDVIVFETQQIANVWSLITISTVKFNKPFFHIFCSSGGQIPRGAIFKTFIFLK